MWLLEKAGHQINSFFDLTAALDWVTMQYAHDILLGERPYIDSLPHI